MRRKMEEEKIKRETQTHTRRWRRRQTDGKTDRQTETISREGKITPRNE